MTTADPIATHMAALESVLRGPRRIRRCMIAEARAGLRDAAESYRTGGLGPEQAAARAVRDFGEVGEVAPSFQEELTARQGRWAAALFAVVFPGMLAGWDALWSTGLVRREHVAPGDLVMALATVQDVVTALVGAAAVALLVITFRRDVSPPRLTRAIGLTGALGAALCGGTAVVMNVAGGRSTTAMLSTNPAAVAAFAASGVMLVVIVWQALRALRVAGAGRS